MYRVAAIITVLFTMFLTFGASAHDAKIKNKETASLSNNPSNRGPFELLNHLGKKVTNRNFLGKYMLVYFGYTYCPDVCPIDLQVVSEAIDLLGKNGAKVQPLFVTVDPERDTVDVMASYVKHFHPSLVGLTGSKKQIASAMQVYRIKARKYFPKDAEAGEYFVEHSAAIVLIGPDGAGLSLYPHGIKAPEIVADIKRFIGFKR